MDRSKQVDMEITEKVLAQELAFHTAELINNLQAKAKNFTNPIFKEVVLEELKIMRNLHTLVLKEVSPEEYSDFFRRVKDRILLRESKPEEVKDKDLSTSENIQDDNLRSEVDG